MWPLDVLAMANGGDDDDGPPKLHDELQRRPHGDDANDGRDNSRWGLMTSLNHLIRNYFRLANVHTFDCQKPSLSTEND